MGGGHAGTWVAKLDGEECGRIWHMPKRVAKDRPRWRAEVFVRTSEWTKGRKIIDASTCDYVDSKIEATESIVDMLHENGHPTSIDW
jgi:hypothetical protein